LLLAILGLSGCGVESPDAAEVKVNSPEEHDRVYREGAELITPYMQLQGRAPRPVSADARKEILRGIRLLERVTEYNPNNWSAYWVMGKGYQAVADPNSACNAFRKSFGIQRQNPDVAREYMFECLKLGRATDGVNAAEHAVSLRPNDAGLLANQALAYLIGGRVDDALRSVDKSLGVAADDQITKDLKRVILEVKSGARPQPRKMSDLEVR
jgi:tetratricopeptide (TPR) repeat protein